MLVTSHLSPAAGHAASRVQLGARGGGGRIDGGAGEVGIGVRLRRGDARGGLAVVGKSIVGKVAVRSSRAGLHRDRTAGARGLRSA